MNDAMLQEQIAYYRARAHDYDAAVPLGPPPGLHLLQQMGPFEQVLELACGTGIWTQALLSIGRVITAVDAAPDMLEINARKVASLRVRYQHADLFTWEPDRQYDLVFFSFWLSHVPPDALDAFLDTVRRAVRPGGYLAIVDQDIPTQEHRLVAQDDIHALRRTSDGRTFTIVKAFHDLTALEDRLTHLGFEVIVHRLGDVLFFLSGRRAER
jgi:demethylmenaquinone methyltransferase/2-methoxy-6-polyprenyl-1,4-benzoquinol methylase